MSSSGNPTYDGDDGGLFDGLRTHRNPYDLNNKIMLTAIVSLSLVVVLVIALHIYARYALRRNAQRQAVLRRLGILALVDSRDPPPHPPTRSSGLNPLVMSSLPVVVFKQQSANPDPDGAAVECAVCLSAVEDGETVRILPNCKHVFHSECIDMWFGSHSTCPICRTEAAPLIVPEPREAPAEAVTEGGGGSVSRLSSFRRILSRERSSRRIQPCVRENRNDDVQDLERQ